MVGRYLAPLLAVGNKEKRAHESRAAINSWKGEKKNPQTDQHSIQTTLLEISNSKSNHKKQWERIRNELHSSLI